MTPPHQRLVVITGGPGSGKSTLIGALHAEGISCVDEAVRTHDAMVEAYVRCGYELVPLPLATLAERVAFVRQRLPE